MSVLKTKVGNADGNSAEWTVVSYLCSRFQMGKGVCFIAP